MTSQTSLSSSEAFAAHYATLKPGLPGSDAAWLAALRDRGIAAFGAAGWPTPKIEAWKYTNLAAALAKLAFEPALPVANGLRAAALPWLLPAEAKAHRLAFVNGRLRDDLSDLGELPAGVELGGLAAALAANPAGLEGRLGRLGAMAEQPLLALNTALMADGFVLKLGPGIELEQPVELLFLALPGAAPLAYHPRGLVLAGRGSRAMLIERHVGTSHAGAGKGTTFANLAFEIELETGAALRHYKLQSEGPEAFHIATNTVRLGRDARYESFVLAQGGRLARNESNIALEGPGAECRLDGVYMGRARQLIDNTLFIDHVAPQATSRQNFRGVLDDYARGVFQGRVLVRPGAQKTDAHQLSRALLLAAGAEIDSKPQLEIHADDVKCSHGAAAGELDSDALFYLRSRGIPEPEARRMLIDAFLASGLDSIGHEGVRDAFRRAVTQWIDKSEKVES